MPLLPTDLPSLLEALGDVAKAVPEVADFLHDLIAGKPAAIERVENILPAKSKSEELLDELEKR